MLEPTKTVTNFIIEDNQELYVLAQTDCRGDSSQEKFKVPLSIIKQAIEYGSIDVKERSDELEDEIDSFLDSFDDYNISVFLSNIIALPNFIPNIKTSDILDELVESGKYLLECEETTCGIGVTKELAILAFSGVEYDNWD